MSIYRVTRGREITFNPAQYESVKVFAVVTQEWGPDDGGPPDSQTLADEMDEELTIYLQQEIDEVAKVTENPNSIVREYRDTEEVN